MSPRAWVAAAATVAAIVAVTATGCGSTDGFDVLIRRGTILDGTGGPAYHADVGIVADRIVAMGDLSAAAARREIDAEHLMVAPGFIDLNGQSGVSLLIDGAAHSHIRQGITTEILGERNTPALWTDRQDRAQIEQSGVAVTWRGFSQYFEHLHRKGVSLNVGSFVPADMIRREILGEEHREPTAAELVQMDRLVLDAMDQGAFGLASALTYAPGSYASRHELTELARTAASVGGIYITHVRGETSRPLEAIGEAIDIGRDASVPVVIYHVKLGARKVWGRTSELRRLIDDARAGGLDVSATQYPYTAGGTELMACLPPWVLYGGRSQARQRLRDPALRARIQREIEDEVQILGWENLVAAAGFEGIQIASVPAGGDQTIVGRTLAELAAAAGVTPWTLFFDLLSIEGRVGATFHMMSETDVERAMQFPWVSISTDSAAVHAEGPLSTGVPHPRAYGTYPRVLGHYVRERQIVSLPEAVRKMTALPAAQVRLADRGTLRVGYFADVVLFDPRTILDQGTFAHPARYPVGVEYVLVNGVVTLDRGQHTGARAGRPVFRPARPNAVRARHAVVPAASVPPY